MVLNSVILLSLIFGCNCLTCNLKYEKVNASLTEVPPDIPSNVCLIVINDNYITSFREFEFSRFPALELVNAMSNKLSYLDEYAFASTKVSELKLGKNSLTEFPDLDSIKLSLVKLYLIGNLITSVPNHRIQNLQKLRTLFIGGNPLTSMTDFHSLLPQMEDLRMEAIKFFCCKEMSNLKEYVDGVVTLDTYPCYQPEMLVNTAWPDIPQSTLLTIRCREY